MLLCFVLPVRLAQFPYFIIQISKFVIANKTFFKNEGRIVKYHTTNTKILQAISKFSPYTPLIKLRIAIVLQENLCSFSFQLSQTTNSQVNVWKSESLVVDDWVDDLYTNVDPWGVSNISAIHFQGDTTNTHNQIATHFFRTLLNSTFV